MNRYATKKMYMGLLNTVYVCFCPTNDQFRTNLVTIFYYTVYYKLYIVNNFTLYRL